VFYLKTDLPFADSELRVLRARALEELQTRTATVGEAVAAAGFPSLVTPLAAGTFHILHRLIGAATGPLVVRSPIRTVFDEDRGLLIEGWVADWLSGTKGAALVPPTVAVHFARHGAPFDFAVMAAARGVPLVDAAIDETPSIPRSIGAALRAVHQIAGEGAGLIDLSSTERRAQPLGVHRDWLDFIALNLHRHIEACVRAGFVDAAMADLIGQMFRDLGPLLSERPSRLLHGDPGTHNISVDGAGEVTALLDWEDALVGDPLFDVAMWSSFHPPRRLPSFLAGYDLDTPTREESCLLAAYFLRIALSKTVHRLRFGIADRPDRMPGHHRIYRGVEELRRCLG
jgi:hypothetical protein